MRLPLVCNSLAIIATGTLILAGCTTSEYKRMPSLAHPGPEAVQRAEYIQHDPYLLNDVGPEVVGARPLSYQQPVPESERALMGRRAVAQPIAVPGAALAAPPVVSSPFAVAPPQTGAPLIGTPPPVVTAPAGVPSYSSVPAPITSPYPPATAPVVTAPYPPVTPQSGSFPSQQRAPY